MKIDYRADVLLTLLLSIVTAGAHAGPVALAPNGCQLAVADSENGSIVLLTLPSLRREAVIPVGHEPQALSFDAAGTRLYVTSRGDAMLIAVDTVRRRVVARAQIGN